MNSFQWVVTLFTFVALFGCNEIRYESQNTTMNFDSITQSNKNKTEIDTIIDNLWKLDSECTEKDNFKELNIEGFSICGKVKKDFLKKHRNYDSIVGYYYFYGPNRIVFENDRIIAFYLYNSKFKIHNFINIGDSTKTLINKFPCSFKDNLKTYSIKLFNNNSDDLTIEYNDFVVTSIQYQIDEP